MIGDVRIEQGLTAWRRESTFLVAFVDASVRADSVGYSWNNTVPALAGVKLVQTNRSGVAQLVAGFSADSRSKLQAPLVYGSYWAAWRGSRTNAGSRLTPSAFPGHVSAISGIVTAREPNNWTTTASVEQGAIVFRAKRISGIPFVRGTGGVDTSRLGWNNRSSVDVGGKLALAMARGVVQAGVAQRREYNRITRAATTAPVLFVDLWFGWNPRVTRP